MKHIGIAAVTAVGASLVYRSICRESERYFGEHVHPEITLHTFSFSEHLREGPEQRARWAELMTASIGKLEASGADFVICPSNTPHAVYQEVCRSIGIPWIHIASVVREEAERRRVRSAVVLGTRYTVESGFYENAFAGSRVTVRPAAKDDTAKLHAIIVDELVRGTVSPESAAWFAGLVRRIVGSGSDSVILGCTELPLLMSGNSEGLEVLDSAALLAEAALRAAAE